MKKMSAVFELPLTGESLEFHLQNTEFCTEQDRAAHAINHVDALADVIENVLHHHGDALSYEIKSWCVDALAAYRGEV